MVNEECDSSSDCPKIQKCVQVHGKCQYGSKKCKFNKECIHPDMCVGGKCVGKNSEDGKRQQEEIPERGIVQDQAPQLATNTNPSENMKVVKPQPKPPSRDTLFKFPILAYICFRDKNQNQR